MVNRRKPSPHPHPDIPIEWIGVAGIDQHFTGGTVQTMRTVPYLRAFLIQGMIEGGMARSPAEIVIDDKYIKSRKSIIPGLPDADYLSPLTIELMENVGIIRRRWVDRIYSATPDSTGPSLQ